MRLLTDRDIYEQFTERLLVQAEHYIWIATANIKGTKMRYRGRFISFVDFLAAMVHRGVAIRIIHAELPSGPFRERYEQLDTRGALSGGIEFLHCIRMHAKLFIVDGRIVLTGSPNLTGAGIGAKGINTRNFETAFLCENEREAEPFVDYFDRVWMGALCPKCGRRDTCPAPPA